MPSYKIHSLKDNKKLSFIIEWVSSGAVEQKLSNEGYIVLSVEEFHPDENAEYFDFEGKKQDGSFISGKISAETIFQAYEMLTKEYAYILDGLYPSHVIDKEEQAKIFTQLQYSFHIESTKKTEVKKDTSQEHVSKNKKNIEEIIAYLETIEIPKKEEILLDLRRIQQMNNNSTIEQTLKEIIKKLYDVLPDKRNIHPTIKSVAKDLHIFLDPPFLLSVKNWYQNMMDFLDPALHNNGEKSGQQEAKNQKTLSLSDPHINKLLCAEYRKSMFPKTKKEQGAFFYTLLRENRGLYMTRKIIHNISRILTATLIFLIFCMGTLTIFWHYSTFFFSGQMLVVLMIIMFASLVFPTETL